MGFVQGCWQRRLLGRRRASAFNSAGCLGVVGDHLGRECLGIRISTVLSQLAGRYLSQITEGGLLDEVRRSRCDAQTPS